MGTFLRREPELPCPCHPPGHRDMAPTRTVRAQIMVTGGSILCDPRAGMGARQAHCHLTNPLAEDMRVATRRDLATSSPYMLR